MTADQLLNLAAENGLEVTVGGVNQEAIRSNIGKVAELGVKESEAEFQRRVIDLAHGYGWRVAHFRAVRIQRSDGTVYYETPVAADGKGFLDLELVRERIVKIECKVRPKRPTPEQLEWLAAYERAGVEVYVFYPDAWDDLVRVLKD